MSRRTQQRDAIRQAIETTDRPLGPQEVLDYAPRQLPRLGLATVYRNSRCFLGWGGTAPSWHRAYRLFANLLAGGR